MGNSEVLIFRTSEEKRRRNEREGASQKFVQVIRIRTLRQMDTTRKSFVVGLLFYLLSVRGVVLWTDLYSVAPTIGFGRTTLRVLTQSHTKNLLGVFPKERLGHFVYFLLPIGSIIWRPYIKKLRRRGSKYDLLLNKRHNERTTSFLE